jgi:2-polyprenyl-3-methyl-5-hydroxy-6-metoxy-1,4-benzoquinol methylase
MSNPLIQYHETQAATGRTFNPDRFFYRFVKPLLKPPEEGRERLIDLGCGAGELCVYARDLGYEVTAVDVSESNVKNVRSLGLAAQVADLNRPLPFEDNSFDFAILVEVIEHVVNAELLLKEIARILRPGGQLLLSTPNHAYYGNRFAALIGKPPKEEGYHFRFFTRKLLESKLAEAGFQIVHRNSFNMDHLLNQIIKHFTRKPV